MRFPSVHTLILHAFHTLLRFPLVLACAFVAMCEGIYLTLFPRSQNVESLKVIAICALGLTLFTSIRLFVETHKWSTYRYWLLNLLGLGLLSAYYFYLPKKPTEMEGLRYTFFNVFLHLLVAVVPYLGSGFYRGFWQYNRSLFLRILLSALYSIVLYVGIVVALSTMHLLLDVQIASEVYVCVFVCLASMFNTWFFLAGVPKDFAQLESDESYPNGLKLFTQYVLLPLVVVYLAILYAYMFRVIVLWTLPKGGVSNWVIGFSILGILSLLLVQPLKDKEENRWIMLFVKGFYLAILPLLFFLHISIFQRIADYGITELRYVVAVTSLWLTGISLYFIFSKQKKIQVIPISLCILTLLASCGPLGAFSLSLWNQKRRIERFLRENDLSHSFKGKEFEQEKGEEISSTVQYVLERDTAFVTQTFHVKAEEAKYELNEAIGLSYKTGTGGYYKSFMLLAQKPKVIELENYRYLITGKSYDQADTAYCQAAPLLVLLKENGRMFDIEYNHKTIAHLNFAHRWDEIVEKMPESYELDTPDSIRTFYLENRFIRLKLLLNNVSLSREKDTTYLNNYDYTLLFDLK